MIQDREETYNAWISLGRQVHRGEKGKSVKRKLKRGFEWIRVFRFDQTEEVGKQIISTPSIRSSTINRKIEKDRRKRTSRTFGWKGTATKLDN